MTTYVIPPASAVQLRQRAKVYVSSAARDLGDARAAVIEAIHRAGCDAVAMESYGADTRPPLARCLLDVGSCETYVGIVAWRYGSRPPGEQKSFTHLEYEEAKRLHKQILIFHLDERADWPTQQVDQSQRDVRKLRRAQAKEHTVEHFRSVEQLTIGVLRGLRDLYSEAIAPLPALLPYVVDRHAQKERLGAAIRNELDRTPSLVVVHGVAGQAHHKFVEHMQEQLLARHLMISGPVHSTAIALRSAEFDQPEVITRRIADGCSLNPTIGVETLSRQLHDFGAVTLLRFPVEVELRRGRPQVRPIARLVDYFARWPQQRPLRVLPVISAQYRDSSSWAGQLLWRSSATDRVEQAIEAACASPSVAIVVLPALTNVEQMEVQVWAEQPEVRRFFADRDPVPMIRQLFTEHEQSSKERGMPMEKLAMELRLMLEQPRPEPSPA